MTQMDLIANTRPALESVAALEDLGYCVNDLGYEQGGDWIKAESKYVRFSYNPINGQMGGDHVSGISFDHTSQELTDCDWYQEILTSLYM